MVAGLDPARFLEPIGEPPDALGILRVHHHHPARTPCRGQHVEDLAVVELQVVAGHEDLERGVAVADEGGERRPERAAEPGEMERLGVAVPGPAPACVQVRARKGPRDGEEAGEDPGEEHRADGKVRDEGHVPPTAHRDSGSDEHHPALGEIGRLLGPRNGVVEAVPAEDLGEHRDRHAGEADDDEGRRDEPERSREAAEVRGHESARPACGGRSPARRGRKRGLVEGAKAGTATGTGTASSAGPVPDGPALRRPAIRR